MFFLQCLFQPCFVLPCFVLQCFFLRLLRGQGAVTCGSARLGKELLKPCRFRGSTSCGITLRDGKCRNIAVFGPVGWLPVGLFALVVAAGG